jgi:hypothetical protein
MNCVSGLRDDSVESTVMVSGVLDGAGGAIRFNQAVVTFNFVTYTFFGLLLDVMCVRVFNSILEFVLWWSLYHDTELLLEFPVADISGLWQINATDCLNGVLRN